MAGFAAYPASLPRLAALWGMSAAEAGLVGGAYFCGYMLAVPFLSGITDRVDARLVYVASCLLAAAGLLLFALGAQGVWSAAALQALIGAGLAGTYMPGLKALVDRAGGARLPRWIAFYTATFGVGTSASLLATGFLEARLSWQASFALLGLGPLAAAGLAWVGLRPVAPQGATGSGWWPRLGPVLREPAVLRVALGYGAHCWELFGLRSWMVAFFAFAAGSGQAALLAPTGAAALINLIGLPASILGNELAAKCGRMRWVAGCMLASGLLCWAAGGAGGGPAWLMLLLVTAHNIAVMGDSAALTAGMVATAPAALRGAALALHSVLGFGAGFIAPLVFGAILDLAGGRGDAHAWWFAYGSLGVWGVVWVLWPRRAVRG
ncbi:MAG: MFS transporter [Rhodocyclaceae bacterium]|nr:MFS transporter [Rhodocyclaceae bacterium]